jgi:hypothetical protein
LVPKFHTKNACVNIDDIESRSHVPRHLIEEHAQERELILLQTQKN